MLEEAMVEGQGAMLAERVAMVEQVGLEAQVPVEELVEWPPVRIAPRVAWVVEEEGDQAPCRT